MNFEPSEFLYIYQANIVSVYDGDTCTASVVLGFDVDIKMKLRLFGINTPEMRGVDKERATVARDALSRLILNKDVIIKTHRDAKEKYGRYLAEVYVKQDDDSYLYVNDFMIQNGHAVRFMEEK